MHSSHWTWQHLWYNVHFIIALIRWSLDNESTIIMKIKILLLTLPRRMIQIQSEHYHKHQELPVLFIWRLCAPSTEGRHLLQHLQFWMDSFIFGTNDHYHEGVCHAISFDLDLYLQDYLAVTWPISWIIVICGTNTTHEGTMCLIYLFNQ